MAFWVQTPAQQVSLELPHEGLISPGRARLCGWTTHRNLQQFLLPGRAARGRFLGVVMRAHLVVCLPWTQGRTRKKQSDWVPGHKQFPAYFARSEELWPNLCFKETTNKCKQSVSKASVQLLASWSPLHCNVCLSILVTAERSSQSRWPIQPASLNRRRGPRVHIFLQLARSTISNTSLNTHNNIERQVLLCSCHRWRKWNAELAPELKLDTNSMTLRLLLYDKMRWLI